MLVILFVGVAAAERSGEIKLSGANGPLFRGEAENRREQRELFSQGNQKFYGNVLEGSYVNVVSTCHTAKNNAKL